MIIFVATNGAASVQHKTEAQALAYTVGLTGWSVVQDEIPDIAPSPNWDKFEQACWDNQDFMLFILTNAVPNGYTTLVATIQNGKRGEAASATLEKCINEFIGITFTPEHLTFLNTTLSDNHFLFTI